MVAPLRAGELNQLITILSAPTTRNSYGDITGTGATFAQVWASVTPKSGSDFIAGGGEQAKAMFEIKIRYLSGVQPEMTITHDSKTYQIMSVFDPDSREEQLQILARQIL